MRAVVVTETGDADQLLLTDQPEPTPGPGDLVVEVAAAGLNFIDTYQRSGLYPMDLPFVPGMEGSGTVVGLGQGVGEFELGDRVAWAQAAGSYAERNVVPARAAVPVPSDIDLETAAAVILQGITAHYLVTDTYSLADGDRCLVHAGAGGVGLLLIQMAKMRGAEVVATVGTAGKAELALAAGADHAVVYTETDFKTAVESLYGPKQMHVIYDGVGAATFMDSLELLRPRGMMVTFGNASGPAPDVSPLLLMRLGSLFVTRPTMGHYIATRAELVSRCNDIFSWMSSGRLSVRVGARFQLAEAAEAHRALESRLTSGKVLLIP